MAQKDMGKGNTKVYSPVAPNFQNNVAVKTPKSDGYKQQTANQSGGAKKKSR